MMNVSCKLAILGGVLHRVLLFSREVFSTTIELIFVKVSQPQTPFYNFIVITKPKSLFYFIKRVKVKIYII